MHVQCLSFGANVMLWKKEEKTMTIASIFYRDATHKLGLTNQINTNIVRHRKRTHTLVEMTMMI